jgi:hypothetical protein
MQIMRLTLTGMATVVLAAMLAGGAADPASAAASPNCKGQHQALVNGPCRASIPDTEIRIALHERRMIAS